MNDMARNDNDRSAWLAALLSFIMPGVGQVYCGRLVRGLVIGLIYGLAIPVALGLLAYIGPATTVVFGLMAVVAAIGAVVAATIDAFRLARQSARPYELKAYNRPGVYVLIGLMIQGSSVGYSLHVRSSLFEAFRVPSTSMYPAIVANDRLLTNKKAYRRLNPQPGDIVLFHPPTDDWRSYHIKRVVARAGDTVEMKAGDLYINGEKLPRELVSSHATATGIDGNTVEGEIYRELNGQASYEVFQALGAAPPADFEPTQVPRDHCFVLGDNRDHSRDSRHFGPIPYAVIEGRADYVYWPADAWSRFGRID